MCFYLTVQFPAICLLFVGVSFKTVPLLVVGGGLCRSLYISVYVLVLFLYYVHFLVL